MPDTKEMLDQVVEKLKKVQHDQFEDLEKKVAEALKAGKSVADLTQQFEKANGQAAKHTDEIQKLSQTLADEKTALNKRLDEFESKYADPAHRNGKVLESVGAGVLKAFGGEAGHEKIYQEQRTEPISVKDGAKAWMTQKNISTATGSGEALADSLRLPGVVSQPEPMLVVQALLPRTFTTNTSVDWVRESGYTDNAATVAESTGTGDLVTKPQSNITFELVTSALQTIAHWIPASRRILRYSNRVQLQAYIDRRLRDRVMLELEDQVISGNGVGTNLSGLLTEATAYNRGYAQIQAADPTGIDTLRRALTQVRLAEYAATGIVLHPADWETIVLTKDAELRYIFAMPGVVTTPRLWGLPVVDSTRMTEGDFLVGAFAQAAELFIGENVMVRVAEQHASFFIQNMVAILGEMDAILAIYRPEALVTGSLAEGS